MTLWGAKGLTADYVYVAGLCDKALPGPHAQSSAGLTEGERLMEQLRLLYVSMTRAGSGLVISRPAKIKRGKAQALGEFGVIRWVGLVCGHGGVLFVVRRLV